MSASQQEEFSNVGNPQDIVCKYSSLDTNLATSSICDCVLRISYVFKGDKAEASGFACLLIHNDLHKARMRFKLAQADIALSRSYQKHDRGSACVSVGVRLVG